MKKKSKYLLTGLSLFFALSTTLSAATIKETTVNGDGYDTINNGDIIIGITRFEGSTIVTGSKVAKASTNDSVHFLKENGSLDNYQSPVIYVYAGIGGWFSLDDDNNASIVSDTNLIEKLENTNIYYVDNIEKKLEIELKDINVDDSTLPKGVTLKDGKLLVNATIDSFEASTIDGQKVSFIKNEGKFILDQSKYYAVDQDGFITNYTGFKGKVEIPSKINDVNIVGIRSGAFDNKGVTEVVIPESVKRIESNAFSNNELTSVIVNEKYDSGDFTNLADDAFGTFTNDKIKYNNDLTKALDKFKDKLTLNVQKNVDLSKEISHYSLAGFAIASEIKRINDSNIVASVIVSGDVGDGPVEENVISAIMEYESDNTFNLRLVNCPNGYAKSVSKTVKYSINKVDGDANYIKSINKVVKANKDDVSNIKENFKDNPSLKLPSYVSITKLISDNNLKSVEVGYENGEEIELGNITLEQRIITNAIYSDDTLYDSYEFETLSANYIFEGDPSKYSSEDEIYEHMVDEFKTKTGITNTTDIEYKNNYDSILDKTVGYHISLTDKDNDNNWSIKMTSNIPNDFTYTHNYGSVIVTDYFPNLSAQDYNSTKEWMEAAIEKYKEKSGATDALNPSFELLTYINGQEIKYTVDSNGNYNYVYRVKIQHTVGTSPTEYWYVYLYKTTKTKIETENYEATSTDIATAINELATEKSLTNYKSSMTGEYYFKDDETGEFKRVNSNYNYTRYALYDLDTDKIWYLFVKQTV